MEALTTPSYRILWMADGSRFELIWRMPAATPYQMRLYRRPYDCMAHNRGSVNFQCWIKMTYYNDPRNPPSILILYR